MKNYKKTPQDCHLYSQTIFKKGLWPCVYCGVQLAHQNSQRLEKHIEHHHPQGIFVCYIFVIWVTKFRNTFIQFMVNFDTLSQLQCHIAAQNVPFALTTPISFKFISKQINVCPKCPETSSLGPKVGTSVWTVSSDWIPSKFILHYLYSATNKQPIFHISLLVV